jgi:hypothetical protein
MTYYQGGPADGLVLVFFAFLSLLVTWLIIYTAVVAGVGHVLSPAARLKADANVTPEGVEFVVTNVGTGPAFDFSVRWLGTPAEAVLAQAPLLQEGAVLRWVVQATPAGPGEASTVRQLQLTWRPGMNPDHMRKYAFLAVLVPPSLAK